MYLPDTYTTFLITDAGETKMIETLWSNDAIDAADKAIIGRIDARAVVVKFNFITLRDDVVYEAKSAPSDDWEFAHAPAVEADEPEGEYIDDDAADAAWESAQGTYNGKVPLPTHTPAIEGVCPFCGMPAHARACPELRALLMDDAIDVDALIDSRDALLDRLAELEAAL